MEQSKNKGRILSLLTYLYRYTDEENPSSTNELIKELSARGYAANRKTVKDDIDVLVSAGFDIITVKSSGNSYFLGERLFELPELKLLIDAVSSSKFISRNKSMELIEKISGLASENQSKYLVERLYTTERIKSDNGRIYYIVDCLAEAIRLGKRVQFQYWDYTVDKEKVLKHDGELYENSPYALVWNDDRYYLIGYSDKYGKVISFRVDRIVEPVIAERDSQPEPVDFKVAEYVKNTFDMFDGVEREVSLICDNELMRVVIDRFGEEIETERYSDTQFRAKVIVNASKTFYGWVFQFAGQIKIEGPESVKQEFMDIIKEFCGSVS